VGTNLKLARDSVALHVKGHSWSLPQGDTLATTLTGVGWAHSEDTWVVGVMPLLYGFHHFGESGWGGALSVGGLWAPTGVPLRLGASARTPARAALSGVIDSIDGRVPVGARLPWRTAAGASWTLGAKNIAGRYAPDKVHVGASDGPTVLLTSEVVWTGGSADAVGLVPLVTGGPIQPAGSSLEVHGGAEADLARRYLRLRAGAYTQPGRFEGTPARGHVTGGVALQVFRFPSDLPWRLTGSIDAAADEVSWGFGLETW
jgi:hypothetical protein